MTNNSGRKKGFITTKAVEAKEMEGHLPEQNHDLLFAYPTVLAISHRSILFKEIY